MKYRRSDGTRVDIRELEITGSGIRPLLQGDRLRLRVQADNLGGMVQGVDPRAWFHFMPELVASATWVNTAGFLTSNPTYTAASRQLSIPVAAPGTTTTDPLSGSYLIGAPINALDNGQPLVSPDAWELGGDMVEVTAPADLTEGICVVMGYCSEAADSGTIEAMFWGMSWVSSARSGIRGRLLNGAVTGGVGGSDSANRAVSNFMSKYGNDTATPTIGSSNSQRARNSAGGAVNSGAFTTTDLATEWTIGTLPRPFLAVFRTVGGGSARTVVLKLSRPAYLSPPVLV